MRLVLADRGHVSRWDPPLVLSYNSPGGPVNEEFTKLLDELRGRGPIVLPAGARFQMIELQRPRAFIPRTSLGELGRWAGGVR